MSQENVEMVRRGIADVDAFWDMLDEYVVWDLRGYPTIDLDPVYVGRDAVIAASRHYWGTWEDYSLEAEEIVEVGPTVVIALHERMRGKGSGVQLDRRWAQAWTFHRGRIIRWDLFEDKAAALEAVALPEAPGMSQENVELARAMFAAWNEHRVDDALRDLHDPNVAILRFVEGWPEPGPLVGREAVMAFYEEMGAGGYTADPISDFIEVGGAVVVRFVWHTTSQGQDVAMEVTSIYTMRRGKVSAIEFFRDHADALEAMGLAE